MNLTLRNQVLRLLVSALLLSVWNCSAAAAELRNWAFGASYTLHPLPSYELTMNTGDAIELTDGRYTSGHFWTSKESVGWKDSGPIQIEIDLGVIRPVDRICINTARGIEAEVDFPEAVGLFASLERDMYIPLGDLYQGKAHGSGTYQVQKYCAFGLAASARYVLLIIRPSGRFTFLDEIEVSGSAEAGTHGHLATMKITRQEATKSMEEDSTTYHRRLALVQLARQTLSHVPDKMQDVHKRVMSLISELRQENAVSASMLIRYQDELFSLNRLMLAGRFRQRLIVWRKSPWEVFSPIDAPPDNTSVNPELTFDLMRHGSASDAFVLTNNSGTVAHVDITMVLQSRRDRGPKAELREVQPVVAANHATIGDALKPIEHGRLSFKPGESKQIWITVHGMQADAGDYRGRIILTGVNGRRLAEEIGVGIKIWAATFPERPLAFVNVWAYLNDRVVASFAQAAAHDLSRHHINVAVLHPSQLPWPDLQKDASRKNDYARSDELLRYQKDVRKRLFFFNFNAKEMRSFGGRLEFMSPEWQRTFKNWIRDWAAHLRGMGLGLHEFAFYPVDEPRSREEANVLEHTAKLIKEVDPHLQVFTTVGELTSVDLVRLKNTVDIFQILLPERSGIRAMTLKTMNKQIWTYTAEGGGKQASPIGFYRAQAWKAFQAGANGIGFWAYADAGPSGSTWNDYDGTGPDYAVIYEGTKGSVGSKRWEAWREGAEDFELLAMARRKLQSSKDIADFDAAVQAVINDPENDRQLEKTRRYLLSRASR